MKDLEKIGAAWKRLGATCKNVAAPILRNHLSLKNKETFGKFCLRIKRVRVDEPYSFWEVIS